MANFRKQRLERNRLRFSRMGKRSQEVQQARRMESITPDYLADVASSQDFSQGKAIGSLQYRCYETGKIMRWTILRGDRRDRVVLHSPDGRRTRSHGWTWIMDHLRKYMVTRSIRHQISS